VDFLWGYPPVPGGLPLSPTVLGELCNTITRQPMELIKPLTDSASLLVHIEKKIRFGFLWVTP